MVRKIKWKGEDFLLVSLSKNTLEGAITTRELYNNFDESIAHLYEDGEICQHGRVIGNIKEIEFLGEEK